MSNLHRDLDEFNLHNPKGFNPATPNTFATKSEQGSSYYEERMQLPKVINIVDGNLPAPSTADLDAFIIIDGGGGVLDLSWGPSSFNDWVRFNGGVPYRISPLAGYLAYNENGSQWKEFDGSNWVDFGGGGVVNTLYTADGSLAGPRAVTMAGNSLAFDGGQTTIKGSGSTSATTALLVQNSLSANLLKFQDDGTHFIGKDSVPVNNLTLHVKSPSGHTRTLNVNGALLGANSTALDITSISSSGTNNGISVSASNTSGTGLVKGVSSSASLTGGNIKYGVLGSALNATTIMAGVRGEVLTGGSVTPSGTVAGVMARNDASLGTNLYGLFSENNPTAANSTIYGVWTKVNNLGTGTTNSIGGYFEATGGTNNYALVTPSTGGNVGIGTVTPTAKLHVKGAGSTSGTTALLVQNSLSTNLLEVKDDGSTTINGSFAVNSSTTFGFNMHVAGSFLKTANGTFRIDGTNTNALTVNGINTYVGAGTKFTVGFTTTSASMGVYGQGADVVNFYTQSTAQRAMRITSTGLSSLSDSATNTENVNSVLTISALDNTDRAHLYFKPKTAAQASGITASDGMITYVNSTDATFTSVGFWGYENGAWVKL